MPILRYQFGSTTVAKVRDSHQLRQILVDPLFDSAFIIVKPNWVSSDPAEFSDAESMRMLFEALDSRIIVTESYSLPRSMNILNEGMNFKVGDREVNWKWLLKGEGWNWLIEHPSWEWFRREGHWDQLREEDRAFRDKYGFTDLFNEFEVTYINVTEEVWSGRVADPGEVRSSVESRFKPVRCESLYHMVPSKLYDLRGSTFISFARLKMYASFTFKNLFGMIPDPMRPWWHGLKDKRIEESIIDINKIYHSLFNIYGICEALKITAFIHPEGEYKGIYTGKYNIGKGSGVVALGRDLLSLDNLLLDLSDPSTRWIAPLNRTTIDLAQEHFGAIDKRGFKAAREKVRDWISPIQTS